MFKTLRSLRPDRFFLEEENPFTKKRKFRTGRLKLVGAASLVLAITYVLVAGSIAEKDADEKRGEDPRDHAHGAELGSHENPPDPSRYEERLSPARAAAPRQYSASQLVKQSDSATLGKLPIGTSFAVRLANTVRSSDSESPVIAQVTDDIFWQNAVLIPQGAKAIGQGQLDEASERLRTRFQTLVYPDGSQHSFSGLALMPDGSSGIAGDYHSGALKRQGGKFLGDFVSGTAQGLKERTASGEVGLTFEPGNIRNGLLGGLANSASDYAQASTENMKSTAPFLEIPQGSSFLIFLEREYAP